MRARAWLGSHRNMAFSSRSPKPRTAVIYHESRGKRPKVGCVLCLFYCCFFVLGDQHREQFVPIYIWSFMWFMWLFVVLSRIEQNMIIRVVACCVTRGMLKLWSTTNFTRDRLARKSPEIWYVIQYRSCVRKSCVCVCLCGVCVSVCVYVVCEFVCLSAWVCLVCVHLVCVFLCSSVSCVCPCGVCFACVVSQGDTK